jgi:hypothetical protein
MMPTHIDLYLREKYAMHKPEIKLKMYESVGCMSIKQIDDKMIAKVLPIPCKERSKSPLVKNSSLSAGRIQSSTV